MIKTNPMQWIIQQTGILISATALRFSTIACADILRDDDGVTNSA
jgi:hypothetical protein